MSKNRGNKIFNDVYLKMAAMAVCIMHFGRIDCQFFPAGGGFLSDYNIVNSKADTFLIKVENLLKSKSKRVGINKICLNIHHKRSSDLKISLINPSGKMIWLTNRNGGEEGFDYTNTCFVASGFSGHIDDGKSPYNGEFTPNGIWEILQSGDPNGDWKLVLEDLREGIKGTLSSWEMFFGEIKNPNMKVCTKKDPKHCVCQDNKKNGKLLPDLVLIPEFTQRGLQQYDRSHNQFPGQLRFGVTIANIGLGPFEMKGSKKWFCDGTMVADSNVICANGKYARQNLIQKIFYKEKGKLKFEEVETGTNYYDNQPGHMHYHVDDWISVNLIKLDQNSGKEKTIVKGQKISYCLFDNGKIKDNFKVNDTHIDITKLKNVGFGFYPDCYSDYQGISVGGYDSYGPMYEGQFLVLPSDLESGQYILEVHLDPKNLFIESDKLNNKFRLNINLN